MISRYLNFVISRPSWVLVCIALLALALSSQLGNFRLDASSDSLVIDGDADLEYSRQVSERYGGKDFVFIMVTPQTELFTTGSLDRLKALQGEINALPHIDSIDSILTVPLFKVSNVSLSELDVDTIVTLEAEGVDLAAARDDLVSSKAYRNALISEDGRSATLAVYFENNETLRDLLSERTDLRENLQAEGLSTEQQDQQQQLSQVEADYDGLKRLTDQQRHDDIASIREIISRYQSDAEIVMGGVPMIADDLVTFVKSDLVNFGSAILLFIIASLSLLFRRFRYVFIPMLSSVVVTLCVTGMLGVLNWPVTVISSNFISLLLIITISLNVHLIVRYRELEKEFPDLSHRERILHSVGSMFQPCLYTSLTTIVAFGSLMISNIPPIVDFGWMMVIGVIFAFLITFSLFPAVLSLFPALPTQSEPESRSGFFSFTALLARLTLNRRVTVLMSAMALAVVVAAGITRLKVENSFINYFAEDTEIYQGMISLDERMGGTTPLDVIISLSRANPFDEGVAVGSDDFWDEDEGDDFWDDEGEGSGEDDFWDDEPGSDLTASSSEEAYWFTSDKMAEIIAMHDYLDAFPETGKVLSLATLLNIAYELNDNEPLNDVELAVLYNRIPDEYKASLLQPYVSVNNDEIRFSIRVRESDPDLIRGELMSRIESGLISEFNLDAEQVHLSGMLVLYNNMLQSLFESQILTLGVVLAVILIMFVVLFRSLSLALIGIIPNILAASLVLGIMGWMGIPLDMMTITIAAISVGIGVDNTIHYIHRFQKGFTEKQGDYAATVNYSHGSIGQAIYYTGFTIVVGFSILVLSNFIPTIYFGLLCSAAMIAALLGSLTLLPALILQFKPLAQQS